MANANPAARPSATATKSKPATGKAVSNGAKVPTRTVSSRRRPTYNIKTHGRQMGFTPNDDFTLKKGANVSLVRPSFNNGALIFRPLPALDPDDPSQFATYMDFATGNLSDVIRSYPAARYVGTPDCPVSFLLYNSEDPSYDPRSNPYEILWRRIYNAVKRDHDIPVVRGVKPGEWLSYIERGTNTKPLLNKPTSLYFMQGVVFRHGSNLYFGRDKTPRGLGSRDLPQIIQLPVSAGDAILAAMTQLKEEFVGMQVEDLEDALEYGDMVAMDKGVFITVANAAGTSHQSSEEDDTFTVGGDSGGGKKSRGFEAKGYGVSIDKTLVNDGRVTKMRAVMPESAVPIIKRHLVWFDDILNFPCHEEICVLLANAFKAKRHILDVGWDEHPDFFSRDVNKILASAKSVTIPNDSDAEPQAADEDEDELGYRLDEEAEEPAPKPKAAGVSSYDEPSEEEPVDADDNEYEDVTPQDENPAEAQTADTVSAGNPDSDVVSGETGDSDYETAEEDAAAAEAPFGEDAEGAADAAADMEGAGDGDEAGDDDVIAGAEDEDTGNSAGSAEEAMESFDERMRAAKAAALARSGQR